MDEYQRGRLARAAEVLGEARERKPGSGNQLIQDQGIAIGKLCYWLADLMALVRELDGQAAADLHPLAADYIAEAAAYQPVDWQARMLGPEVRHP